MQFERAVLRQTAAHNIQHQVLPDLSQLMPVSHLHPIRVFALELNEVWPLPLAQWQQCLLVSDHLTKLQ